MLHTTLTRVNSRPDAHEHNKRAALSGIWAGARLIQAKATHQRNQSAKLTVIIFVQAELISELLYWITLDCISVPEVVTAFAVTAARSESRYKQIACSYFLTSWIDSVCAHIGLCLGVAASDSGFAVLSPVLHWHLCCCFCQVWDVIAVRKSWYPQNYNPEADANGFPHSAAHDNNLNKYTTVAYTKHPLYWPQYLQQQL